MPSSSHLPLILFINLVLFHFHLTNPPSNVRKFKLLFSSSSFSGSEMAKTRGAHTYRPQVHQGPSLSTVGPYSAAAGSPAADIVAFGPFPAAVSSSAVGPSAAGVSTGPRAPAVHPTSAPAAVAPAAGDAGGSSSVAPAQRSHHT